MLEKPKKISEQKTTALEKVILQHKDNQVDILRNDKFFCQLPIERLNNKYFEIGLHIKIIHSPS